MKHFDREKDKALLEGLKNPEMFIDVYNNIADEMNALEKDLQSHDSDIDYSGASDLLYCRAENGGIRFHINNLVNNYHDSTYIISIIKVIVERHINPNFLVYKEQ